MRNQNGNYAFIDSQNLNRAIQSLKWRLDFKKFHDYLKREYGVTRSLLFIGYMEEHRELYEALSSHGYELVYKTVLPSKEGVKGNIDADLVLRAMIEYPHYRQAVIVTGDGDFASLVEYLKNQRKLKCLIVPNMHRYSSLLKEAAGEQVVFLNDLREQLGARQSSKLHISTPRKQAETHGRTGQKPALESMFSVASTDAATPHGGRRKMERRRSSRRRHRRPHGNSDGGKFGLTT